MSEPRRLTYLGSTKTVRAWSKIVSIPAKTLNKRFRLGWDVEKILTTPVGKKVRVLDDQQRERKNQLQRAAYARRADEKKELEFESKEPVEVEEACEIVKEKNAIAWNSFPNDKKIKFIQLGRWLERRRLNFVDHRVMVCEKCNKVQHMRSGRKVCASCREEKYVAMKVA
jgi:hypothetical protein